MCVCWCHGCVRCRNVKFFIKRKDGWRARLLLCVTPLTLCPLFLSSVCECAVSLCAVTIQGMITINRLLFVCLLSVVSAVLVDTAISSYVFLLYWLRRFPVMQHWRSCQGTHLVLNASTHSDEVFLCWLLWYSDTEALLHSTWPSQLGWGTVSYQTGLNDLRLTEMRNSTLHVTQLTIVTIVYYSVFYQLTAI